MNVEDALKDGFLGFLQLDSVVKPLLPKPVEVNAKGEDFLDITSITATPTLLERLWVVSKADKVLITNTASVSRVHLG